MNGSSGAEKCNKWNKNIIKGVDNRFKLAAEKITELENRLIVITQFKKQRKEIQ